MPEGDTIHRASRRIGAVLTGHVPREIRAPHARHARERWPERLAGRAVRSVDAYGKHLFIRFEGGLTLHSHLRMSGAWAVQREGGGFRRAPSRTWLLLRCEGWEVAEFDGPVLELMSDARTRSDPRLRALGQDVLGARFDEQQFLRALRAEEDGRAVGDALLDQRLLAGIGNVWKSEACFAAGIDPWRTLGALEDDEALAILAFARERMAVAVRDGAGARPRAVYRRAGRPCERCGGPIRRRGQGENNRVTFWCTRCQR